MRRRDYSAIFPDIVSMWEETNLSTAEVAQIFNLSQQTVDHILRNRGYTKLTRPNRSHRLVVEYRENGWLYSDIAKQLNININQVAYICKRYHCEYTPEEKIKAKLIGHQRGSVSAKQSEAVKKSVDDLRLTFNEIVDRVKQKSDGHFYYAGGYINSYQNFNIGCTTCGHVIPVSGGVLKPSKMTLTMMVCPNCKKIEREKTKEQKRSAQEELHRKQILNQLPTFSCIRVVFCKKCGEMFYTSNKKRKYCSNKCSQKVKDDRLKKLSEVDKSISLKKLYKRDYGTCYICGQACDWNDAEIKDGVFIAGENYPSIEHILPLCKGGQHTWDNVKLAHRHCNNQKGRKLWQEQLALTTQS